MLEIICRFHAIQKGDDCCIGKRQVARNSTEGISGVVNEPSLYRCAVTIAGVFDWELFDEWFLNLKAMGKEAVFVLAFTPRPHAIQGISTSAGLDEP